MLLTVGAVVISSGLLAFSLMKDRRKVIAANPSPTISHVIIYPIKGCKGVERYSSQITADGLAHDRQYCLIIRDSSVFDGWTTLSQVRCPKLATIAVSMASSADQLEVSAPGMSSLKIRGTMSGVQHEVKFWDWMIRVVDQGDETSRWFSEYLGLDCRFCRILPGMNRKHIKTGEISQNSLYYGHTLLVMAAESIQSLAAAVGEDIQYDRFRPNIVLKNVEYPFQEDTFASISSGVWTLDGSELCVRCSYPGVDQTTGVLDPSLVGKFRSLRNKDHIKMNPLYEQAAKTWKHNDYMVGVYMSARSGTNSRIFVGQEITPQY